MADQIRILRLAYQTDALIGVGPGRCGTLSLAKILSSSPRVHCVHEAYRMTEGMTPDVGEMMRRLEPIRDGNLHGQVGMLWLGLVPIIRLQYPNLPVVCLHRDKDAVIRSYMKRQENRKRPWLLNIFGPVDRVTPTYLAEHWDWCETQMEFIGDPVFHMQTEELGSDSKLNELYEFLGVPDSARRFPYERRFHVATDVAEREDQTQIDYFDALPSAAAGG